MLRTAVDLGIRHIDTADFYGPYVTNELIREALAPYPENLHIVTKVSARRDEHGGWPHARTPAELRDQVHDNLRHLGLDVVNLRVGGVEAPEPPRESLIPLVSDGDIRAPKKALALAGPEHLTIGEMLAPVL